MKFLNVLYDKIFGPGVGSSGPNAIEVEVDLANDSLDIIKKKLDLMREYNDIRHGEQNRKSRRTMLSITFYLLLVFMMAIMAWSIYIYLYSVDAGNIEKANFVFSTLASAAVASLIGLIATAPPSR